MGIFDDLKDLAESTTKSVTSKSKEISAKTDMKLRINALKKEVQEATVNIRRANEYVGEMYLGEKLDGIPMEEEKLEDLIEEIEKNRSEIIKLKKKICDEEQALEEKLKDIMREKYEN